MKINEHNDKTKLKRYVRPQIGNHGFEFWAQSDDLMTGWERVPPELETEADAAWCRAMGIQFVRAEAMP